MAIERVYLEIAIIKKKNNPEDVSLIVKSQPFIEYQLYSNHGRNTNEFTASNGFCLASSSMPEISGRNFLYLRGDDPSRDMHICSVPNEYIEGGFIDRLRVAVQEYNAWLDSIYDIEDAKGRAVDGIEFDYSYTPTQEPGKKILRVLV